METISRSWELLGQSFSILKSDKELMWLPILSASFCLTAAVIIGGTGLLLVLPPGPIPQNPTQLKLLEQAMAPFIFLLYVVIYSFATYFNVALVSIAGDRLSGGHATLNDGLQAAWQRKWSIFQWALFAATVGMLLSMLERSLSFLGRLLTRTTSFVWTLASFFVVPLLAAEDMGPVEALSKSGRIFRQTWGKEVAGGLGFGVIFSLLTVPGFLLPVLGARFGGQPGVVAGFAVAVIYWLLLGVVNSAARAIFVAALYRYATTGQTSGGYRPDDLSGAWQPKML